jgi:hypothetical protein
MKKLMLIFTALFIASSSLTACGGEDPGIEALEPEEAVTTSAVREDGATCMVDCSTGSHSECGSRWYMVRHALPNVTRNCASTASLWCSNRGWSLYNAWWSHHPENRAWCY